VPQAWASAAPVLREATALQTSSAGAAVRALDSIRPEGLFGGLPLTQMPGRAMTTSESRLELPTLRILPEAVG
jgi:hypothetical protein